MKFAIYKHHSIAISLVSVIFHLQPVKTLCVPPVQTPAKAESMNFGAAAAVLYLTTPLAQDGAHPLRSLLYINFSKLLYYGEIMDAILAAAAEAAAPFPCREIKAIFHAEYKRGL